MKTAIIPLAIAAFFFTSCKSGKTEVSVSDAKPYPLETCVVSGEKLGEMGKPHVFVHEGKEVKLCCKNCLKDFDKEPAKYIAKIDAATAK